jgi:hypothetical protein
MNWKWTRAVAIGALGLAASGAIGCAQERDPINRVQADALAKSFFVGEDLTSDVDNPEFYANGTLLDIGYGAAQDGLFTAFYSNDMSIIRWEVTEQYLIGRLGYERIEGSDGKGAGQEINDGQVLYVFNIGKHFDIRRAYNPSTGEEMNVIEENTSDRPWYEREYMRVDWSQNMQTDAYDFDTGAIYGLFFGVEYEPLAYYINDPNHEHAPHFEPSDGYFDITTRAYAKPGMVDLSHFGWGIDAIPACFLDGDFAGGTAPAANCNPHEITIRHSFWKKPNNDYEPQDWDGFRFQSFGAFTKERYGFARNYGMSDDLWRRFISRYNLWQRSHYYADPDNMEGAVECFTPNTTPVGADPKRDQDIFDANGTLVTGANGTHDECEAVTAATGLPGSRCDTFSQKCTLPYAGREIRPIVWYFTDTSDNRFFEGTNWATQEWNVAMKIAVASARNSDCHRTADPAVTDCDAVYPVIHGQMTQYRDVVETQKEIDACLDQAGAWDDSCNGIIEQELTSRGYTTDSYDYIGMATVLAMPRAVVLCHSPVEAGDHPECNPGKPRLPENVSAYDCQNAKAEGGDAATRTACASAYRVRIGDVRHHLINVVESPETPSPWGFGPTYADPTTGEAISASVNVWTYPTDLISQLVTDISRFIGGELSAADVTDGEFVTDWVKAAELAANGGMMRGMSQEERARRIVGAYKSISRDLVTGEAGKFEATGTIDPALTHRLKTIRNDVRADVMAPSVMAPKYAQRMAHAHGSATEAALTTIPMMQLAGTDQLGGEASLQFASPLRGNINPSMRRQLDHLKEVSLAKRGACMLKSDHYAPGPTAMVGLTGILQEKFGAFSASDDSTTQLVRAEKMRTYLAQRMHYAVMIHEMGHTFGYRHNFVSSSSAFNYRPQYWQLRTRNGQVGSTLEQNGAIQGVPAEQLCTDLQSRADSANCVGPRYFDQVTEEEERNLQQMWAHSSVMDYAGDYTQDLIGLGAYDFAAAKMFYGDTVALFADDDLKQQATGPDLSRSITSTIMDNFGGIVGYSYETPQSDFQTGLPIGIHYSELNAWYKLINNCQNVDTEVFKPTYWNEERDGVWHPTIDGLIVNVDGNYSRCFQRRVTHRSWDDLEFPDVDGFYRGGPAISKEGHTRVPYAFATDRWADLGNISVYRHDIGADTYELFNFLVTEQELMHIFYDYRRNRQTFTVRGASGRLLNRYNTKIRDGAKGMTLIYNNIKDFSLSNGFDVDSTWALYVNAFGWDDNMLASGLAFDHYARQMQRPQAGPHVLDAGGTLRSDDFGTPDLIVPDGVQGFWQDVGIGGKIVENRLAEGMGEYGVEFTINAGSYYDKLYTTMLLTESVDNFVSDSLDDFTDPRYRAVSIADLFPDGYRRWLSNNLTGDTMIKAPRVAAVASNIPDVRPEDLYPAYPMGWTSWWQDTPEICFPAQGTTVCSGFNPEDGTALNPLLPAATIPVDPQVEWEQQKFLVAWTMVYLPENQKQTWIDMLAMWKIGDNTDPGFDNRIELHIPTGDTFVARTYGTEEICFESCKTVQRGISARVLEYANELLATAYDVTAVTNAYGTTWYEPVYDADGQATCLQPAACETFNDYISLPEFMQHAMTDFHGPDAVTKGIY